MAEDDPMQLYQKFTESFNKIARPEENGEDKKTVLILPNVT